MPRGVAAPADVATAQSMPPLHLTRPCMCRWGRIAELVEGKNKLQCARHFKEMKAQAKKN